MSASIIGTTNGLTRPGPRSRSTSYSCMSVVMPPMAVPMTVATRGLTSGVMSRPLCFRASSAATKANCVKRSARRASFRSMYAVGLKSFTSPGTWDTYPSGSNRVMRPVPDFPATSACQLSQALCPRAVIMPMPVTATRLLTVWASKWLKLVRSIASGLHLFDHHRQPVTEIAGEQAAFAELLPQGFARRGMEVDAQAGSIERFEPLGEVGADHAREHVAGASRGEKRVRIGAERGAATGRGDHAVRALEHDDTPELLGGFAGGIEALCLHFVDGRVHE